MAIIERTRKDIYPFISAKGRLAGSASGKTVLITGGGKGIGKAMAEHFALAGASSIIITGRDSAALAATKSSIEAATPSAQVTPVVADVTSEADVARLFDPSLLPNGGKLPDIVLNNAGAWLSQERVGDGGPGSADAWWRDWEINVRGIYLVARAYVRALAGRPGAIINTSTIVAISDIPASSSYAGSKTAVNRLSELLHLEYADRGVRVLAFHPGGIASTGMGGEAPEALRPHMTDTVDLAAGTALWLSTPEAAFLDGRFYVANWDAEQVAKHKDVVVARNLLKTKIEFGDVFTL